MNSGNEVPRGAVHVGGHPHSRTDSRPCAHNSVIGHFSTVAAGHSAKATVKTPESGWVPGRRHSAPEPSRTALLPGRLILVALTLEMYCCVDAVDDFFQVGPLMSVRETGIAHPNSGLAQLG
jgi:hypothetical protein